MKKSFLGLVVLFICGGACAQSLQSQSNKPNQITQNNQIKPHADTGSVRTMKIKSDEQDDQAKRKAFIDELRSLYKINFL